MPNLALPEEILDGLSGISNLLTNLAEQAYDLHGIDGMLTTPQQTLEDSLRRRGTQLRADTIATALTRALTIEAQRVAAGGGGDEGTLLAHLVGLVGWGPARALIDEALRPPEPTPPAEPVPETTAMPTGEEPPTTALPVEPVPIPVL